MKPNERLTRRTAITIGCAWAAASMAGAQQKISQKDAQYQDSPKDIRMCATCTLFLPPKSCTVVSGEVSPNGWCKLFVIAD